MRRRDGFALLIVLLVLIALLILSAPFLMMARNSDRASVELTDRARARLGLDAAARHGRLQLGESHPGIDHTPYYDSKEEVTVDNHFDPAFLDANDEKGLMWDLEGDDVAGEVDLNSAPPQMIANLMGVSTRLSRAIKEKEKEVPLGSTTNFAPSGVVWVGGELLRYTTVAEGAMVEPLRGVLGPANASEWHGGPLPPSAHDAGAPVIDQRAFAPALWRIATQTGDVRAFDSKERLREAGGFALAAADAAPKTKGGEVDAKAAARAVLTEDALRPLFLHGSIHGGVRGGNVWQRPVRIVDAIQGGKDGILRVDRARWLNPGSTVQITDGSTTELALVQEVRKSGEVVLDRVLQGDYTAGLATLRVLARRPVNLNTASSQVLEALFANLQVVGRNSRITRDEAEKLATLVVESRPFEGFEDFLKRAVLPAAGLEKLPSDAPVLPASLSGLAAGSGFIDPDDALALYMNGLNANDVGLAYSTMPYAFVTRDTYDLELRATVDAPSGVERFSLVREETDLVVPQRQLFALWARQEDFDETLRLDLEAPWWMTGPNATSRYDGGSVPPSRLWAGMGTAEGKTYLPGVTDMSAFKDRASPPTPEHVFASRESTGWIHLWPSRVEESSPRLKDRVMHFDHETRDPEGRYLPDQVVTRPTDDAQIAWTSTKSPLCRPVSFSLWVKPRAITDSMLLDVGGTSHDSDRVSLLFQGSDLVFRMVSAGGDHPDTPEKEYGEARFAIARGSGPGLPLDVWSHIEVDARGTRPDQIHMLVNGLAQGVRTPGMTRLTASIGQNDAVIPVESGEGFPARCTVRIGSELVEVEVTGSQMNATRHDTGAAAGFGGRVARERFSSLKTDGVDLPANLANIATAHPAGTPVELAGYSMPLQSSISTGKGTLTADVGPFRVAVVTGLTRTNGQNYPGETLAWGALGWVIGTGMDGLTSQVGGLTLSCADDPSIQPANFMSAFNTGGGYAAVIQILGTDGTDVAKTTSGTVIGGVELIRYSGWTGSTLNIAARGDVVQSELPDLAGLQGNNANVIGGGRRAFTVMWAYGPDNAEMHWKVYVVPISIPVTNGAGLQTTPPADKDHSRVLQITHLSDAENTEWVRYDHYAASGSQFVRDDPLALRAVYDRIIFRHDLPNHFQAMAAPEPPTPPPPAVVQQSTGGSQWLPDLGVDENQAKTPKYYFSASVSDELQFRGVMGTHAHAHTAGTAVLPVFNVAERDLDAGRPGSFDAAFLFGPTFDHLGWPVHVHRAHAPATVVGVRRWKQQDPTHFIAVIDGEENSKLPPIYLYNSSFVALQDKAPEPIVPGSVGGANLNIVDTRAIARLTLFPSGERPRLVGTAAVGGGFDGSQSGAVPSATIDEVVFGNAQLPLHTPNVDAESMAGASFVLSTDLPEAGNQARVYSGVMRIAGGDLSENYEFLTETPDDAGLLRIGSEIVCYDQRDPTTGQINLATSGRGLLGTRPQPHQIMEPVTFLENRIVSFLASGLGPGDASIQLANVQDFPSEGTVIIGTELIHYTRIHENALEMPRASSQPGHMDHKGDGLFRGRFGTTPMAHAQGDPVILFPFRYWDRWQSRADAPELAYFTLSIDQPAAYWDACYFDKEDAESCQIGVLARVEPDAPWDADPEADPRLRLYWKGDADGKPIPIGRQSDRIDWRVFVKYAPGAFDATTGLAHGWTQTPTLKKFGAFYFGPGMVLSSVER